MRRITVARVSSYLVGSLFLFALSAMPSHADCAAAGTPSTPYLVFGTQSVGQSGLTQTATLTFTTACPATISNIAISVSGTNAGDFTAAGNGATPCSPTSTFNISNGSPASCTIGATFAPTAAGTRTAAITVSFTVTGAINDGPATVNLVGGDEVVYVTTGSGGQVLTVDGITPNVFQVLSNGPCNTAGCFQPTGAVVGPDGKIYVTDQVNNNIWRMNQNGTQLEQVYNGGAAGCPDSNSSTIPCLPEGPSFSGSGKGDLYFDTFQTTGSGDGLFVISGAATTPFGGPFSSPANVSASLPYTGTGTGFDATGNLLAADQEDEDILSVPPPYSHNTASSILGIGGVVGIALNKANGQVYLSSVDSGQILQLVPPDPELYSTSTYYTFSSTSPNCSFSPGAPDLPEYLQFDMAGRAFVPTSTAPLNENGPSFSQGCGKVWRIDPGVSPTATMLVDLNSVFTNGIAGICFVPCGLNSQQAIGLAMPPSGGSTQTVALSSTGGTISVGWPVGCTPTNTPPNNCSSTIGVQYPANMFSDADVLNVTFTETSQQQFVANAGGSPYAKTTLAPVEGYNGNGIVPTLLCTNGGNPCSDTVTPGTPYNIFTTWQSNQTNYCSLAPHLLRGDPAGGPYATLTDTIIGCTDGGVGTKGQSSCSSTSSSSCLSDWDNTFGSIFQFVGFASPINNTGVNIIKAGQAVPISFQVLDGNGKPVTTLTMPPVSIIFTPTSCSNFSAADNTDLPDVTAAGNSGFQNLGGGNYQLNWKTTKGQTGCGLIQVNLGDGVAHTAEFQFK